MGPDARTIAPLALTALCDRLSGQLDQLKDSATGSLQKLQDGTDTLKSDIGARLDAIEDQAGSTQALQTQLNALSNRTTESLDGLQAQIQSL